MPTEADLYKIYETYYTHQVCDGRADHTDNARPPSVVLRPFLKVLKFGHQLLGYLTGMNSALPHARMDAAQMYLVNNRAGRLLDIGCGNGVFLDRMQSLGWTVQGVEVDSKSAKVAIESFGIPVYVGSIEEAKYPHSYFDAITLSHVIEHVYDPIGLLRECHRILKPGGTLVAVTPNSTSLGHERFEQSWIALDPPRHLHLFARSTIEPVADKAGFKKTEVWTTPANAEWHAFTSMDIRSHGYHRMGDSPSLARIITSRWFQLRAFIDHRKNPASGEELVLKAWK
jgi:2-polyprenyl-3-methyl-5-hydroxy-6-metoxy-1,4-benzoquinol methylase